jgi:SnoaL-like domain
MTVPQLSKSARLAQLEQRVQALEDVNAIRHLKARYAAYCDDQYNPDGLAALFTEDAGTLGAVGQGGMPVTADPIRGSITAPCADAVCGAFSS